MKKLYPDLKQDPNFQQYFADKYPEDKLPCREYFFNILNTVYPDYLSSILDNAQKIRNTVDGDEQKNEAIKVTDEWMQQLNAMPFRSSKYILLHLTLTFHITEQNGKTLYLLKQNTKPYSGKKRRKTFELLGTLNEFKHVQQIEQ